MLTFALFKKLFVTVLLLGIGSGLIYYSYQLTRFFGKVAWAERNLGGTRAMYVLMGFLIMVLGFLILFGVIEFGRVGDFRSITNSSTQTLDEGSQDTSR